MTSTANAPIRIAVRWWTVAIVVVAWELITVIGHVDSAIVPGPYTVVRRLASSPGTFGGPLADTALTAAIGLITGVAAGLFVSCISWFTPVIAGFLTPLAVIIRSLPFVALVPILALVLGYGTVSAVIICGLVCFFPTYVLVSSGLRQLPAGTFAYFAVAGSSRPQRFYRLALPAAVPALVTAVRISAATSIAAALVAEFLMGTPGLAYLLETSLNDLDVVGVWAASVVAVVAALIAFLVTSRLEDVVRRRWG